MKISELIPDDKNYNTGNEFGNSLIEKSLRKNGAGRSILIDKNNRIIAGNKTVENAASIGLEDLLIVESDGTKIIAVKRTDIDLDSKKGRELALADNASAKANIVWNHENLKEDWGDDELKGWGIEDEAEKYDDEFTLPDGGKPPFQQMTFTLADEQAGIVQAAIDAIKSTDDYKYCETMGNENSNGNALYLIVKQWDEQRK